jgi:hypothetical protein
MGSESTPLAPEERALIERVARRVVELHLEVPAILALESSKPLALLASQTLIFLEPVLLAVLPLPDYRRFAVLVERRDALELLTESIERGADGRREAERAARASRVPPNSR